MNALLETQLTLGALLIFGARVLNIALDTLRMLFVMRNQRLWTWISGFFVSLIYILLLTSLLAHIDNPVYIIAYTAGYATGSVVGMWIEERMALGFKLVHIVSRGYGMHLAQILRQAGFGVTEIPARGRDGSATLLNVSTRRKEIPTLETMVRSVDPQAFITELDVRPVYRGIWKK
ncbi:MAG: DUF2179 domain-containing protein [Anaerolineales bacterium]